MLIAQASAPQPSAAPGIRVCVDRAGLVTHAISPKLDKPPDKAANTHGSVTVLVTVDATGKVLGATLGQSDVPFLNAAAIDAAAHSTYSPPTHGCDPVQGQVTYQVNYAAATPAPKNQAPQNASPPSCTPGPAWIKSTPAQRIPRVGLTTPGAAKFRVAVSDTGAVTSVTQLSSDVPQGYSDAALAMVKGGTYGPKLSDACVAVPDEIDVSIGFHP
jgi:TonB family protein